MHACASFGDHPAPGRIIGRDRQVHETQDRLDDHRDPHFQRQQHDDRGQHIGQDLDQHRPDPPAPRDLRRGDIVHRPLAHRFGAHDPGKARPVDDNNCDNDRPKAWPDHRNQQDGKQHRREGHPDVDQARDEDVDPTAQKARQQAQNGPDDTGDRACNQRHRHRHPRPVQDAAQHVAAQTVGAQPITGFGARHPERRQAAQEQVLRQRVFRADPGGQQGGQKQQRQPARRKPQPQPDLAPHLSAPVTHDAAGGSAQHRPDRRSGSRR